MIPPAGRSFAKNQATRAKMVSWVVLDHPGRIGSETMSHVAEINASVQKAPEHVH